MTPRLSDSRVKCGNEAREIKEIEDKVCLELHWCSQAVPCSQCWCGVAPAAKGLQGLRSPGMAKQQGGGGCGQSRAPQMVGAREVLPRDRADSSPMVHPVLQKPIPELLPEPQRTHGRSLGAFVGSLLIQLCLF